LPEKSDMKSCLRLASIAVISLLLLQALPAQIRDFSLIQGEVWADRDPLELGIPQAQHDDSIITRQVLEDVRTYVSGMIYGYKFSYIPLDRTRQISEKLEILPLALIAWGSPGLSASQFQKLPDRLWYRIRYETNKAEQYRLAFWNRSSIPDSTGLGKVPLADSVLSRKQAFEAACREAIRAYARGTTLNKPDEIRGSFSLASIPYFRVADAYYEAKVRIFLIIDKVDAYRTY